MHYRDIWIKNNGPLPYDEQGRIYEIHHIDGDCKNNKLENLKAVSIQEHYDIHYKQGDFGACVLIAKRMNMLPNFISSIQTGITRTGAGGVKKGQVPWNKGLSGYKLNYTEKGKQVQKEIKEKRALIKQETKTQIRNIYNNKPNLDDPRIGTVSKNGKLYSYHRAFCLKYANVYNVHPNYIDRIIKHV